MATQIDTTIKYTDYAALDQIVQQIALDWMAERIVALPSQTNPINNEVHNAVASNVDVLYNYYEQNNMDGPVIDVFDYEYALVAKNDLIKTVKYNYIDNFLDIFNKCDYCSMYGCGCDTQPCPSDGQPCTSYGQPQTTAAIKVIQTDGGILYIESTWYVDSIYAAYIIDNIHQPSGKMILEAVRNESGLGEVVFSTFTTEFVQINSISGDTTITPGMTSGTITVNGYTGNTPCACGIV